MPNNHNYLINSMPISQTFDIKKEGFQFFGSSSQNRFIDCFMILHSKSRENLNFQHTFKWFMKRKCVLSVISHLEKKQFEKTHKRIP